VEAVKLNKSNGSKRGVESLLISLKLLVKAALLLVTCLLVLWVLRTIFVPSPDLLALFAEWDREFPVRDYRHDCIRAANGAGACPAAPINPR